MKRRRERPRKRRPVLIRIRVPVDLLDRHPRSGPALLPLLEDIADHKLPGAGDELMRLGPAVGFLDCDPVGVRPFRMHVPPCPIMRAAAMFLRRLTGRLLKRAMGLEPTTLSLGS